MSSARDIGLLLLRLGVGGVSFAHGAQKLVGWFGGGGREGTGAFFSSLGFEPGKRNATLSGLCEAGGGALLALGLATGPAGAALAANMAVASSTHAPNGLWASGGGYELPATYGLVGTSFALVGPGCYSLDALTGGVLNKPWMRVLTVLGGAASAYYLIGQRAKVLAARPQEPVEPAPEDNPDDLA